MWNLPDFQFDSEEGRGIGVFRNWVECFLQWVFCVENGYMQRFGAETSPVYYFKERRDKAGRLVFRCLGRVYGLMYLHWTHISMWLALCIRQAHGQIGDSEGIRGTVAGEGAVLLFRFICTG